VIGDSAYVVCGESIEGAELVATNVFVREDGTWKLVHHQAGPVHRHVRGDSPGEGKGTARPRRGSGMLN
jgi:hypothetical protein